MVMVSLPETDNRLPECPGLRCSRRWLSLQRMLILSMTSDGVTAGTDTRRSESTIPRLSRASMVGEGVRSKPAVESRPTKRPRVCTSCRSKERSDKNYNIRPHASKSSKPIIEGLQSIFAADYIYLGIVFAVGVKILL